MTKNPVSRQKYLNELHVARIKFLAYFHVNLLLVSKETKFEMDL
jgi:hypothetical protein